jgi:hypothetical protein
MANEADIKTIAAGSSWLPHHHNLWFRVVLAKNMNSELVLTVERSQTLPA